MDRADLLLIVLLTAVAVGELVFFALVLLR